jgi:predicted nucleic acid-binding Zn ribbon protein
MTTGYSDRACEVCRAKMTGVRSQKRTCSEVCRTRKRRARIRFDLAWFAMECVGACDAKGGMEYTRVFGEYLRDGRPGGLAAYIRKRAR